jgi:hypothetical protein
MLPIPRLLSENVALITLAHNAKVSGDELPTQAACMSYGSRRGKTAAQIKIHCIEGRMERGRVCQSYAKERALA